MTALAIALGFLGLLAFLAFREWLKRQDFAAALAQAQAEMKRELEEAVLQVTAESSERYRSEVESLALRVGHIEAFAGIGEVKN